MVQQDSLPQTRPLRGLSDRMAGAEREDGILLWDGAPVKAGERIRLFDVLDGTWTEPMVAARVYDHYMRKVVLRCSACLFHTSFDGGVNAHVLQLDKHSEAEVEERFLEQGGVVYACTGCSQSSASKSVMAKHVTERQAEAAAHSRVNVEELIMHRYSLGPSETIILGRTALRLAGEPVVGALVPEGTQVGGRRRRQHRSRHRRREGSGS